MDRREFIITGGATISASLLATLPARALAQATGAGGDAALNALFERIFQEQVRTNPTFATFLGLDKGELAPLRSQLDIRPTVQARAEELARTRKFISWLEAIPETGLSDNGKLNREVVIWDLKTGIIGPERYDIADPQQPYVITQQNGAYFGRPDFLHSAHPIDNASDAEAYLSRLAQFATELDNDTAELRRQAARGFNAPGWSLDLALKQMGELRSPAPEQNSMADSIASRAAAKSIAGDWRGRAAKIIAGQVYPALDRQMAAVRAL
ncbi:MAG TPA: DUF885 family protein, partial [Sphingomicrobium sp.]|nr:DUF885 family protein [Sphingomicrobium sp.]